MIEKNIIQINGGIIVSVDMSVKNVMYAKKIIFGTYRCSCEYGRYLTSIMDSLAITCDEIKNAEAQSNDEEPPPTNFSEKNITFKIQMLFTNYHFIIDSF